MLVPQDNDTAGDIYDAWIDGGFAESCRLGECEGDACQGPLTNPAPLLVAGSATVNGEGNLISALFGGVGVRSKRAKVRKPDAVARRRPVRGDGVGAGVRAVSRGVVW